MADTITAPDTLEGCQELLLILMNDAEKIWSDLQDPEKPKTYKSKGEYQAWRLKASNAQIYKMTQVDTLLAHIEKSYGRTYENKQALILAIRERQVKAPHWLETVMIGNGSNAYSEEEPNMELLAKSSIQFITAILDRLIVARGKLTQGDVATRLGVSNSAISAWERGRSPITLATVLLLCQLYEVNPVYILVGRDKIKTTDVQALVEQFQENVDLLKSLLE